jgi:homoserine kinase
MRETFAALDADATGLSLTCENRIPHGRGLGSSAAAICGGVLLARQLVPGGVDRLDEPAVLALAGRIEGHPDNIAACLLGGVTIAWGDQFGQFRAVRIEPSVNLRPVVFIPGFESSTQVARKLLPPSVPHADAAFNAARAALLVATLTGDLSTLLIATEDRLHQPYRAPAMPAAAELVAELRTAGIAAVVSGAGPTVMAMCVSAAQSEAAQASAPADWIAFAPTVDRGGAVVQNA